MTISPSSIKFGQSYHVGTSGYVPLNNQSLAYYFQSRPCMGTERADARFASFEHNGSVGRGRLINSLDAVAAYFEKPGAYYQCAYLGYTPHRGIGKTIADAGGVVHIHR